MSRAPRPAVPPRPLPIVGGHLALDFANTVDDPGGERAWDHLHDRPSLVDWLRRNEALPPATLDGLPTPDDPSRIVRRAHRLRRAVNDYFGSLAAGNPEPDQRAWRALRPFVAASVGSALPGLDGDDVVLRWAGDDESILLHPVATAAGALATDPRVRHLKRCGNCPWLFLDLSRNGSRRWCDMDDCGRAVKIRRYVERRRERTAQRGVTGAGGAPADARDDRSRARPRR